jgi:hypothetical protein
MPYVTTECIQRTIQAYLWDKIHIGKVHAGIKHTAIYRRAEAYGAPNLKRGQRLQIVS